MTKDEIKKALKMCANTCFRLCCPYGDALGDCCGKLKRDALNLITEQENEIERLRTTLGQYNTELNSALESLKSECREIGELKAEIKQAKIDVLNELKRKYGFYTCFSWHHEPKLLGEIIDEMIDKIIK